MSVSFVTAGVPVSQVKSFDLPDGVSTVSANLASGWTMTLHIHGIDEAEAVLAAAQRIVDEFRSRLSVQDVAE